MFLSIGVVLFLIVLIIVIIMETNASKTSAKDFFLNLGVIVALYTVVVALLNLLFTVINVSYPKITGAYQYYAGSQSISLPVATLIIFFPIFILLMWLLERSFRVEPEKRNLPVKKWLSFITLFIGGIALAGDLVTVLYYFLDGQEMTAAFLLKVLAVFVVALMIFLFYIAEIRNRLTSKSRKVWLGISLALLLASVIWGFAVLGSPSTQRLVKLDMQKVSELQNMQWQIVNYWQTNGSIPQTWESQTLDPQNNKPYEYRKTGEMTFELCAEFNRESTNTNNQYGDMMRDYSIAKPGIMGNEDWRHEAGRHCFEREIDPVAYPTQVRG